MNKVSRLAVVLLVLFVLSGFAGLIYQSVWSHYLGLTLGHAAYAQTLVLAIFMGGMAVGSWLASRHGVRWKRLILAYAIVEAVIGLAGLVFHGVFVGYTSFSQQTVLPVLASPALAHAYQWGTAALMILPQTILLGATFPLMSSGLIRVLPQEQGEVLGGLYFTNSLGAALGALLTTFVLIPAVGLPGTILTAGGLNILVALGAWGLSYKLGESGGSPATKLTPSADASGRVYPDSSTRSLGRVVLAATAVSGAASFVYEIGWVRLLNQALGATVHSFELMLAAFIAGLAFGGLWVRKRAHAITDPVRYVGYVQVLMGIAALLSIPVFTQSFYWVEWMLSALSKTEGGYVLYELGTATISLLVMFPAAFFAGMTLPLFTLALLRRGAGEQVIGRVYAANTLGAIVGVAIAMHVLIPLIGVRLMVTLAALIDAFVGLYILRAISPAKLSRPVAAAALCTAAGVAFSLHLGHVDPRTQVSGVFRTGRLTMPESTVEFLRDGKTATVSVSSGTFNRLIATNGKPDASIFPADLPPSSDEHTMVMAGILALVKHPAPKRIAVIGWGSGLTTHTLAGSPLPEVVDTVEIERAMYDGARLFGTSVSRAYEDPRSKLHIDDARTFFSTGRRKYDVIVSEPSNPWVSGVAGLFTQEFYKFLKSHLNDGGMLVQWLHLYEINNELVATMLHALVKEFPDANLYITNSLDILIVAPTGKREGSFSSAVLPGSDLERELKRVGLDSAKLIEIRRLGDVETIRNFVGMMGAKPHSDYYPVVTFDAPKSRFMDERAVTLLELVDNGMPVLDILNCRQPLPLGNEPLVRYNHLGELRNRASRWTNVALKFEKREASFDSEFREIVANASMIRDMSQRLASEPQLLNPWSSGVALVARQTIGILAPEDLTETWETAAWLPAEAKAIPEVQAIMAAYSAAARRSPREMRLQAEKVLALPKAKVSQAARGQMLVIAMLGALGEGDKPAVQRLDQRWGQSIGGFESIRSYLLAWAAGPSPVCFAQNQMSADRTKGQAMGARPSAPASH